MNQSAHRDHGRLEIYENAALLADIVSVEAKVIWKGQTERIYSHALRKDLDKCQSWLTQALQSKQQYGRIWCRMYPRGNRMCSRNSKSLISIKSFVNGMPESLIKDTKVVELPPEGDDTQD